MRNENKKFLKKLLIERQERRLSVRDKKSSSMQLKIRLRKKKRLNRRRSIARSECMTRPETWCSRGRRS